MENIKTCYQLQYQKLHDSSGEWFIKCTCSEKWQAEKFRDVLEQVSNVYKALQVVPVQVKEQKKEGKAK
jgi:hypothetical protein